MDAPLLVTVVLVGVGLGAFALATWLVVSRPKR